MKPYSWMRYYDWFWAYQTGVDSGIRWYRPVKVRLSFGMIVSIESTTPKGAWSPKDGDLPDISGMRIGDTAPEEARKRARKITLFEYKLDKRELSRSKEVQSG